MKTQQEIADIITRLTALRDTKLAEVADLNDLITVVSTTTVQLKIENDDLKATVSTMQATIDTQIGIISKPATP